MKVKYCPTEKMIADFMSKPLQGSLYQTFRKVIMGWDHVNKLFDHFGSNEERVGNNGKLPVEQKQVKQTYADIVRSTNAVQTQDHLIAKGLDPTDHHGPMTKLESLN